MASPSLWGHWGWLHRGTQASPGHVPGWAVLSPLVSEPVFDVDPGQAALLWHGAVTAPGNFSSSAPGLPGSGDHRNGGHSGAVSLLLGFAALFISILIRQKLIFLWGLPFRCCLSYPAEQETDEAQLSDVKLH